MIDPNPALVEGLKDTSDMASPKSPPPIPRRADAERLSGEFVCLEAVTKGPPPIPEAALPKLGLEDLQITGDLNDHPVAKQKLAELARDEQTEARSTEADALVEAARRGDPRAFEALVKRYRHRIFALALHMTGSPSDADDITQDAFVRAFRSMDRFEGRSEFFTWLYRIALNRALNVRRDQARRRTTDLEDPRVVVAIAVDSGGDPARALELRETYVTLVKAFDKLSPLLKTTVALTMMQGLSYPEAAVVLETTEGTVAWRIHEARKQMRAGIEAFFADRRKTPEEVTAKIRRARPETAEPSTLEMALALLAPSV
jgi:RNA polymerase sigma-70 factor (ECF subfamily)